MSENIEDVVAKILDDTRARIVSNMSEIWYNMYDEPRWVTASGKSAQAFAVERDGSKIMLVYRGGSEVAPLDSLERGYKGPADPSKLKKWKKVKTGEGMTDKAAARLAKRIEEEGTERYNDPIDFIYTSEVVRTTAFLDQVLPDVAAQEVREKINELLKK